MKTTITQDFELKDFEASGQYLVRSDSTQIEDDGYLSTIMYKVGYIHNVGGSRNQHYCLISMSDGWVSNGEYSGDSFIPYDSKESFVRMINEREASQKLRMATKEEVLRVVNYQKNRWLENL